MLPVVVRNNPRPRHAVQCISEKFLQIILYLIHCGLCRAYKKYEILECLADKTGWSLEVWEAYILTYDHVIVTRIRDDLRLQSMSVYFKQTNHAV